MRPGPIAAALLTLTLATTLAGQPAQPPVRVASVRVAGLEALPEPVRLPRLPLRPGATYTLPRVEATERLVAGALAAQGYPFAAVSVSGSVDPERGVADLVIEVAPGPRTVFGPVTVEASPPLREEDVLARLAFRPGERFRADALEHTSERLHRLGIVQGVAIQPGRAAEADTIVPILITVATHEARGIQLEGAFSTFDCLEGMLGWTSRYFLGSPSTFSVGGGASNLLARPLRRFPCTRVGEDEFADPDYFLRTDLRRPLGPDTWLLLGGGVRRESSPHRYVHAGAQLRLGVSHMLARGLDGNVVYTPERGDSRAAGPLYCGVHGVCDEPAIAALTRDVTLAPLELSLGWAPPGARRPPPFLPPPTGLARRPSPDWIYSAFAALTAAGAPTLSDFGFARLTLDGRLARILGPRLELASRVRAGALAPAGEPLPPQVRLFGGGPLGVRGVAPNLLGPALLTATPAVAEELGCVLAPGGCEGLVVGPDRAFVRPTGGTALLEAAVEARLWIASGVQLAAFLDHGTVWSGGAALVAAAEGTTSPGVGIFAATPFGPVRVDVAYDPATPRRRPLLVRLADDGPFVSLGEVIHDPFTFDDPGRGRELWRRLQFQFSMGTPF
jgi:outer membrane protein assembly factor BamA